MPTRRLSARRGSTSAPDPYATHADINENPNRTSSSKLTIVRVLSPQPAPSPAITLKEAPPSFNSSSRRRRPGPGSSSASDSPPPGRLSFAFSNFGPADTSHGSDRSGAPSSPTSSPRLRPSSPRLSAIGSTGSFSGKPRLTPDELVELARQASNPRTLAQIASTPGASSPLPSSAQSGGGHSLTGSPVLRSQSIHLPNVSTQVAPATFTPLPDDIYLPFIDRPYEVSQLISTPPDAKLFALLAQNLPKVYAGPGGDPMDDPNATTIHLPQDPSLWTYPHLVHHLTQVDRDVAPDPIWTFAARKCILSHSELIWERVKGAFGVPPELDIDIDFKRRRNRTSSGEKLHAKMRKLRAELREGAPKRRPGQSGSADESVFDDEESEEESEEEVGPYGATGHWSDWDASVDSPVNARIPVPTGESRRDSVHNVGGVVIGSFNDPSSVEISMQGPSPPLEPTTVDEEEEEDFISIQPLLAPSPENTGTLSSNPPPPLSQQARELLSAGVAADTPAAEGLGLGDIAEGEEDEEEGADNGDGAKEDAINKDEEELIPPSQIQGLLIKTNPVHAAGAYGAGGRFVPHHHHSFPFLTLNDPTLVSSPIPTSPGAADAGDNPGSRTLAQALGQGEPNESSAKGSTHIILPPAGGRRPSQSRTSSFSSVTGVSIGPFSRSESTGSLAAYMAQRGPNQNAGSEAGDSAGYGSDWSAGATAGGSTGTGAPLVEIVGDRLPGQPLFVSNFARLNGCPTLKGAGSPPGRTTPHRFHVKQRTGSTGAFGSIPSSSFLGTHGIGKGSDTEIGLRTRTLSHGALHAGK
ncbi:hypothetical protein D9611_006320 [Ephemerocybe angulata]|uniref:Uncharacterized protein n=1 Tax=Ephemerocybe angulata TaxID=980116 RepID=A0A8H5C6I5_9AGAR|nr:hypothetical protein D9611_006320 [Tulosesus angulatus]